MGHGDPGGGLRDAVSHGNIRYPNILHDPSHQFHGAGGPADNSPGQGGPIFFLEFGVVHQGNQHARRTVDRGAFFPGNDR